MRFEGESLALDISKTSKNNGVLFLSGWVYIDNIFDWWLCLYLEINTELNQRD
jgi:hypothetical protein